MPVLSRRRTVVGAALIASALAAGQLNVVPASAATASFPVFAARAYGSDVSLGSTVVSGRTADVPLCTTLATKSLSDDTAATSLGRVGSVGAVTTNVHSSMSGTTDTTVASSTTGRTSLLGGLVRLEAMSTTATVSHQPANPAYIRGASVNFAGLEIAGIPIIARPAVDQTITLPGVGSVELNHQTAYFSMGAHGETVSALILTVTAGNSSGYPAGTVVLGHTTAALHDRIVSFPYGNASATTVKVGSAIHSGPTAPVTMPCGGSGGATVTGTTAGVHVPGAITTGATTSTARSIDEENKETSTQRDTIADVSLLGGIVSVGTVTTQANAYRTTTFASTSTGTSISGLKIKGRSYTGSTGENTAIAISGVGTLYLHRVGHTSSSIKVYGMELVLSSTVDGVASGTSIIVGQAYAGVLAP